MNAFFNRLASRAVDGAEAVRPRTPTLFEPAHGLELAGDAGAPRTDTPPAERRLEERTAPPFENEANFAARLADLESILDQTPARGAVSARTGSHEQARVFPTPVPAPNLPTAIPPSEPALGSTAHNSETPALPVAVPAPGASPSMPTVNSQAATPLFALAKRITPPDSGRALDKQPILGQPLPTQPAVPMAKPVPTQTSSRLSTVSTRAISLSRVENRPERTIPQSAQTKLTPASVVPSVRLAPPFAPPMAAATPQPIHVTIGRLEIRAVPAPAGRPRSARRPAPVVGLEEYLRGRAAGGAA